MPEETAVADVAKETESVVDGGQTGKVSMEADDTAESSTETEGQDTTGQVDKTNSEGQDAAEEGTDDKEMDEALKKGQSIPYERFKQWNEKSKTLKSELDTMKAENEEVAELLNNPEVFKSVLKAKGITDPNILSQKMKEAGFETEESIPKKELFRKLGDGLDLTTQEGWFEMMERMVGHFSKEAIQPIEQKLTQKEVQSYVESQESEAKKLSKETYGIEYGVSGKDEKNINTAVGKMAAYLSKHPEDARLGHVKVLRLALADEGVKLGEKKGLQKEKERLRSLKTSAMEDDAQVTRDGSPNSEWSVSEILAWRRKNAK